MGESFTATTAVYPRFGDRDQPAAFPEPPAGDLSMLVQSLTILYLLIKAAYFASLLKAFVGSESLQSKPLMMAILYTAGVGGMSYFYLFSEWQQNPNWMWTWIGLSLVASYIFYWILARYEDVWVIWWTTLIGGTILIIFFV